MPLLTQDLPDLSDLDREAWGDALQELVARHGDYIVLDDDHHVMQLGEGDRLIVTFESAHDICNSQDDALPLGLSLATRLEASIMIVMCMRPTWFRAQPVYDFFDALTDEGVFDGFDHVVFYGAGMGGYGACAFAPAAPGCDVVAVSPHATLDPRVTEWDPRFTSLRRRSFTDRYGFGPEMVEAARAALVLYNPDDDLEAMHAALYARPAVTRFRCRYMGRDLTAAFAEMDVLVDMLTLAMDQSLDLTSFAKLYRRRRDYAPYLRLLLRETEDQDRPKLTIWLASNVYPRKAMPRMRRALERASDAADSPSAAQ
ncbi:MAG: phosphoadenosine phosphosulfate reductase [Pseudomonadota bacterium]